MTHVFLEQYRMVAVSQKVDVKAQLQGVNIAFRPASRA
jgi:hypothetical protein